MLLLILLQNVPTVVNKQSKKGDGVSYDLLLSTAVD